MCLTRQGASTNMQHDLPEPPRDLNLRWTSRRLIDYWGFRTRQLLGQFAPNDLTSNFENDIDIDVIKYASNRLDERITLMLK